MQIEIGQDRKAFADTDLEIIRQLEIDFQSFSDNEKAFDFKILLVSNPPPEFLALSKRPAWMRPKMCLVMGWQPRILEYGNQHWIWWKNPKEIFVCGTDFGLLYEMVFTTILSRLGEELELMGYVRLHSLSFQLKDRNCILIAPRGFGKSTLAQSLKRDGVAAVFGDEITHYKDGQLHTFPIRFAVHLFEDEVQEEARAFQRKKFDTKFLIPNPAPPMTLPLHKVLFGRIGRSNSIRSLNFKDKWALSLSVLLGLGLPQMREFLIRPPLSRLFRILYFRWKALDEILALTRIYEKSLTENSPVKELQFLKGQLQ